MSATGVLDPPKSSTIDAPPTAWPMADRDRIRPGGGAGRPVGHWVSGLDDYYRVPATPDGSFEYGISLLNNGPWPVTITDPGGFTAPFVSDDLLMGTFHHGGATFDDLVPFRPTTIDRYESLWVVYRGHFDCRSYPPGSSAATETLPLTFRVFCLTRHEDIPLEGSSLLVVASDACPST